MFYDPVGNIYLQKVCWDALSDSLAKGRKLYLEQLAGIEKMIAPRYLFIDTNDIISNITLHGFCDSSIQAYCAAIWYNFSITHFKDEGCSNKEIVDSTIQVTAVLVSRIGVCCVTKILQDVVAIDENFFWSDLEVASAWVKGKD